MRPGRRTGHFPPGTYKVTTVDATPKGSITLWAFGARFVNTAQVATLGTPILRIRGSASRDITVIGLQVSGPRLTSSTATVGTGVYADSGYPRRNRHLHRPPRRAVHVQADGTYFAEHQTHYCTDLHVGSAAAGTTATPAFCSRTARRRSPRGTRLMTLAPTMVTDGYGITASTS